MAERDYTIAAVDRAMRVLESDEQQPGFPFQMRAVLHGRI